MKVNVSKTVINAPTQIGILNNILKAIADPIIS